MIFQSMCCGSEVKPFGHGYICVNCQDWTLPKAKYHISERDMFLAMQQSEVVLATYGNCLRLVIDCNFFTQRNVIRLYKDKTLYQQWNMQEWKMAYKVYTREAIAVNK